MVVADTAVTAAGQLKRVPNAVRPTVNAARRMVKAIAPNATEIAYQSKPLRSLRNAGPGLPRLVHNPLAGATRAAHLQAVRSSDLAQRGDSLRGFTQLRPATRLEPARRSPRELWEFSLDSPLRLSGSAGGGGLDNSRISHRKCEHIGAQLGPRIRCRPASDERDLRGCDPCSAKRVKRVCDPERHPFEPRADDRVPPGVRTQSAEDPGRLRPVRRALP